MASLLIVNALVWSGVAAAAAAVVEAARPDASPPAAVPRVVAPVGDAATARASDPSLPLSALAAIAERPLFTPGRRPPAAARVEADSGGAAPPAVALRGVVGFEGDRIAIARLGDETLRLRAGDVVAGWTVATVEARTMTLRAGADHHRVRLGDAPPDAAAAARATGPAGTRARGAPAPGQFDLDFSAPDSEQYD